MGYSDHLRRLLRPLGVYDLRPESLSGAELEALGQGLDGVSARMDYVERAKGTKHTGGTQTYSRQNTNTCK